VRNRLEQSSYYTFLSSCSATHFFSIRSALHKKLSLHDFQAGSACRVASRVLKKCRLVYTFSKKSSCEGGRDIQASGLDQRTMESRPRSSDHQKRCCLKGRVVQRPSLDQSPLDSSPRSSEQKKRCCKIGRVVQRPSLDKSPLDSSPRSFEQKKRCCKIGRVVQRPTLDKSPLDSSPRSSEQEHSQKMFSSAFKHAVQPFMAQRVSNLLFSSS